MLNVVLGLFGIPLVFVVFGLQIYTAALLGKSWIIATTLDPMILQKNRQDYNWKTTKNHKIKRKDLFTEFFVITFLYFRIIINLFNCQKIVLQLNILFILRYPLAAVTELTLGPRARTIITLLLDLTIFVCGIPNLLVGRSIIII